MIMNFLESQDPDTLYGF
jgi:ATP-binding cassette subfamily C (CFTR/MRP) protein 2